jgi:8-oxo-dGTP pyrophosphatase MutT (NUDIX family)
MNEGVVVVIRRSGRVLVIQRGPGARLTGYWSPPSGRIEPGETQAQTVVREMREELGLEVWPRAKIWQCETDDGSFRLHWWDADADDYELSLNRNEVSAAIWVNTPEFLELDPTFRGGREFFRIVLPTIAPP